MSRDVNVVCILVLSVLTYQIAKSTIQSASVSSSNRFTKKPFNKASHIILRADAGDEKLPPTCDSEIYCQGDLLRTIQMAKIHKDSKTFVDMSLRSKPEDVLNNFKEMMKTANDKPTNEQIKEFVAKNFELGIELDEWTPSDYQPNPAFLKKVTDSKAHNFAEKVVSIWPKLGRKVKSIVKEHPKQHSLIYVPNGFIIPGGRFREFYYWDSYWIVQGLLLSEMHETVKDMLGNFLHMVDIYGFVPNGGRVYYLNRSQPPLLMKMAREYVNATNDIAWVKEKISLLTKECQFWIDKKFTTVKVNGREYKMATYVSKSLGPRPESYIEDVITAGIYTKEEDKQKLYNELKAAAQSGWDFSTRWIFDNDGGINANISYTATSRVIPVDLNAFLYGAFNDLSELYAMIGQKSSWDTSASDLKEAIRNVLWDDVDGIWYDFDLQLGKRRKIYFASNMAPLWTKAYDVTLKDEYGGRVAAYLKSEKITDYEGGIPTSKVISKQQWDLPNAWPPLQSIVIHGLKDTGNKEAVSISDYFLRKWVSANMLGFESTGGALSEKYDSVLPGKYGGGGEYEVQTGFGWTNGVILDFISMLYSGNKRHDSVPYIVVCSTILGFVIVN